MPIYNTLNKYIFLNSHSYIMTLGNELNYFEAMQTDDTFVPYIYPEYFFASEFEVLQGPTSSMENDIFFILY